MMMKTLETMRAMRSRQVPHGLLTMALKTSINFKDYDITASPNDFNVRTIVDFIEAGPFKIPGFQRNYVWDRKRASKLIESVLIGLPVPQVFLYEEDRNSFLVIDGQQRLMSIFYFVKGRFPRRAQRPAIRRVIAERGDLPKEIFGGRRVLPEVQPLSTRCRWRPKIPLPWQEFRHPW